MASSATAEVPLPSTSAASSSAPTTSSGPKVYRLAVVGGGGQGKSALTKQFLEGEFTEEYNPTVEDLHRKEIMVDGQFVIIDIVDTAGQEEYAMRRQEAMRDCDGFVIVYSVTSRVSVDEARSLHQEIIRSKGDVKKAYPIVLVGTNADRNEDRQVTKEQVEELAAELGNCPFYESSAKVKINIDQVFVETVRVIRRHNNELVPKSKGKKAKMSVFSWVKSKVKHIFKGPKGHSFTVDPTPPPGASALSTDSASSGPPQRAAPVPVADPAAAAREAAAALAKQKEIEELTAQVEALEKAKAQKAQEEAKQALDDAKQAQILAIENQIAQLKQQKAMADAAKAQAAAAAAAAARVPEWPVTAEMKATSDAFFNSVHQNGVVYDAHIFPMIIASRPYVNEAILRHLWDLVDVIRIRCLDGEQFAVFFLLVMTYLSDPNTFLPARYIPPSRRGALLFEGLTRVKDPLYIRALAAEGFSINYLLSDGSNRNILHVAIQLGGEPNMVRTLVECGVNLNHTTTQGETPLHYAKLNNQPLVFEYLVGMGADRSIRDFNGATADELVL